MFSSARSVREDLEPGRWIVESLHEGHTWQVIVEPDLLDRLIVVITAYPVEYP